MISTRGGFAARARQDRWHQQMRGVVAEALRGDRVRRHAVLDGVHVPNVTKVTLRNRSVFNGLQVGP